MHCDTMKEILDCKRLDSRANLRRNNLHVDIEKMKKGDYMLQVFAAYTNMKAEQPLSECLKIIDLFHNEIEANRDDIGLVLSYQDILRNS